MPETDLAHIATRRTESLFHQDVKDQDRAIHATLKQARVLVIGGAGSIGSATLHQILRYDPAAVHVVDQSENELAELIRTIRSGPEPVLVPDLQMLPLDYGSAAFRSFVRSSAPYDLVLNFAAIKHVRSEKDSFSIMQMFDTNIVKQAALLELLGAIGFTGRYFSVSTDKAANPTSMMGASKRVMEHVMFDQGLTSELSCTITSARFANVAFSNGSLLQSFENRLKKGQALAVPKATKRYFVSLAEAGQLCLLAATIAPDRQIVIPKLDPEEALVEMQDIAESFLRANALEPVHYHEEDAACRSVSKEAAQGCWPLLLTELSTSGEKPYEEFVGSGEEVVDLGWKWVEGVTYKPLADPQTMPRVLDMVRTAFQGAEIKVPSKEMLKGIIAKAEPAFLHGHRETGENLDNRV